MKDAHRSLCNAFGDEPHVWARASPLAWAAQAQTPFQLALREPSVDRTLAGRQFARLVRRQAGQFVTAIDVAKLTHQDVNHDIGKKGDQIMTPNVIAFVEGKGCGGRE